MKARAVLIIAAGVVAAAALAWLLLPRTGDVGTGGPVAVGVQPTPTPAPVHRVTLLFPAADGLLHPELREVRLPVEVGARAQMVVEELLAGSRAGLGTLFPYPAEVLGVYVDHDGHAFVDLSGPEEPLQGSHTELMLAYGTVDSILLNCPELSSVQLLFSGTEVATLTGHLDLSRPLPLNKYVIAVR